MNVLALTRYSAMGASSRLRMVQFMADDSFAGVSFVFSPLLGDDYLASLYAGKRFSRGLLLRAYARRLAVLRTAGRFDVLWIEKELFPNFPSVFEWLLVCFNVPYLVDYDDAIFHNYDHSHNPFKWLLRNKIAAVMRHARIVVAGNCYLAVYAKKAGAARIEVLPTVVDDTRYIATSGRTNMPRIIGWMGSPSSVKFLESVLPVLARLADRYAIEFVVVGATIDCRRYPFMSCRPWSELTEVADVSNFDIGIMPLPDDPWERGKCGYKLIQYMACGKPVVASPVGVNTELVIDGQNGFLASTSESWFVALSRLITDRTLCDTLGRQGRQMVEDNYCLRVTAPRLATIMQEAAAPHGKAVEQPRADASRLRS
ncbi:MAG: glycosyltransferase family 4 protein [Burkholderiaceae bacterium]